MNNILKLISETLANNPYLTLDKECIYGRDGQLAYITEDTSYEYKSNLIIVREEGLVIVVNVSNGYIVTV